MKYIIGIIIGIIITFFGIIEKQSEEVFNPNIKEKEVKDISESSISKEEALNLVGQMYKDKNGNIPIDILVEVDHEEGNNYVIHVYNVIKDSESISHTATLGWYYVDKSNGNIKNMFEEYNN